MKIILKDMKIFKLLFSMMLIFSLTACHSDEPEPIPDDITKGPESINPLSHVKRTVLLYAVASNNLSYNLGLDLKEITTGANGVDLNKHRLLIYSVETDPQTGGATIPTLRMLIKTSYGYDYKTLCQYPEDIRSLNPERISQVIEDMQRISPSDEYGLIFWSHSDGWRPASTWSPDAGDEEANTTEPANAPMFHAFGQDFDGNLSHYCETDELAAAIPSGVFKYIWFDSCYMSNIESIYEFEGKTDYYIGSCTELISYGMPYDVTFRYLMGVGGDIVDAAKASMNYYNNLNYAITMCVVDMSHLSEVAQASRICFSSFSPLPSSIALQCYSRKINTPFYDFLQYAREMANYTGTDVAPLEQALNKFIVYKDHSRYDFNRRVIESDKYCGISAHSYKNVNSVEEEKYRTLRWFKDVYPQ